MVIATATTQLSDADELLVITQLQAAGKISDPITFNGQIVSQKNANTGLPSSIVPNYDPVTGWASNTTTALGGMRGKHTDQAIADILAANEDAMAAYVPKYIMGRFWMPPDPYTGFAQYDPARYEPPTAAQQAALGLTDNEVQQLLSNLIAQNNFEFSSTILSGLTPQSLQIKYRGQKGLAGFPKYQPVTASGGVWVAGEPTPPVMTVQQAAIAGNYFWYPQPFALGTGQLGRPQWNPSGPVVQDHWLCDVWWNLQTDMDAARYIRAWAIAFGVDIPLEPTP
jgi:hypothetical protein